MMTLERRACSITKSWKHSQDGYKEPEPSWQEKVEEKLTPSLGSKGKTNNQKNQTKNSGKLLRTFFLYFSSA